MDNQPLKIYRHGEAVGSVVNPASKDGHISGAWLPDDSETARRFQAEVGGSVDGSVEVEVGGVRRPGDAAIADGQINVLFRPATQG